MKTPVSRRVFFWSLTLSYAIVTVIVLFFAFGYRFNFERSIFVYSGSLTVKSNPRDTVVSIDGDATKGLRNIINNSYHITGFRPGDHVIGVSKDGFQSWEKKVYFTSGRSTEFWNVLLARNVYEREKYDTPAISNYYLAPKEKLAAVVAQADHLKVSILDRKDNISTQLLDEPTLTFTTDPRENIEWSPEARSLIIPVERTQTQAPDAPQEDNDEQDEVSNNDRTKDYIIVERKTGESISLSQLSAQDLPLRTVRWDPRNKDVVYYIAGETLYRLPLEEPEEKEVISSEVVAYDFTDDGLYFYTQNNILNRSSIDAPEKSKQLTSLDLSQAHDVDRMIAYDKHRIVLLTRAGDLYFYNDGDEDEVFIKVGENISSVHFSNDGKKLLYWSDNEIFTFFTRKWETQPIRHEGEQIDIARFSQSIKNVHWAKTFEHVIFTIDDEIKVIELDHRDRRNMHTIMQLRTDHPHVVSDFADDELFLIDQVNDTSTLFSITFPEDEGLL